MKLHQKITFIPICLPAGRMRKQAKQYEAQIEELYKQIGKLTAQYEWMKKIWNLISIGSSILVFPKAVHQEIAAAKIISA